MSPAPAPARDWPETFRLWAKPPSETEEQKASNAEGMIRDAVRASDTLRGRGVVVYATGSYRNNTNVRTESDVDIAVVTQDTFFYDPPSGIDAATLGISPATYTFEAFREDVGAALAVKFGRGMVPGDKAFNIHETSHRLDADVAVFFPHRRYTGTRFSDGRWQFHEGVEMTPRAGVPPRIINWHQQHYERGVAKNDATGRRFKRVTRILKRLRTAMVESGDQAARAAALPIASFLIESLVYNVSNEMFNQAAETYYEDARRVIGWLWNQINNGQHMDFKEVSEMKWLFRSGQTWTPEQSKAFLGAAWSYVGFASS